MLITVAAYTTFCYFNPSWPSFAALTGWIILAAIAIIPTLAVHVQYLIKNSNLQLTISSEQLFFETKKQNVSYSFSFVRSLEKTSSFERGSWYLFGDYRYYKITFNDGADFFITSLLVPNIELNLVSKLGLQEEKKDLIVKNEKRRKDLELICLKIADKKRLPVSGSLYC